MAVCAVVLADGTIRDIIMAEIHDALPDGAHLLAAIPDYHLSAGSNGVTQAWRYDFVNRVFVSPAPVGGPVPF